MQRICETTIVLLLLFLIAGVFIIVYSRLMWHVFPRALGLALLFALALLKGLVIKAKQFQTSAPLIDNDARLLKLILLSICSIFLVIIYTSYLLKNQQVALGSFRARLAHPQKGIKVSARLLTAFPFYLIIIKT
jgi:hypothetical protein